MRVFACLMLFGRSVQLNWKKVLGFVIMCLDIVVMCLEEPSIFVCHSDLDPYIFAH